MLPIGVMARKLMEDPAGRNRLIGAVLACILLIGAFSTGLSINIEFGGADRGGRTSFASTSLDGTPESGLDGDLDTDLGIDFGGGTGDDAPPSSGVSDISPAASSSSPLRPSGPPASSGGSTVGSPTPPPSSSGSAAPPVAAAAPSATTIPIPQSDPCAGASLGETDQGVSGEEIKLGLLLSNLDALTLAGFAIGADISSTKSIQSWIDEMNLKGVACRQITWVSREFDVTSTDDMLRACKELVQDEKVFSVVTVGGYDSVAQLCIAKDGQTPFINPEAEPASWHRDAAPYLWNITSSKDRGHINHVRYLVEHGHLDKDDTIGVIYDGTPHVAPATEAGLLPELKRQGLAAKVFKLSADTEQALGQIGQVVIDFQLAGVDFVFMPMNLIYKTQFMQSAENQNYFPQYTDSDHNFGCFDFTTTTYPERSFNDTLCVTSVDALGRVDIQEFADSHPFTLYGDEVWARANGESYHPDGPGSDNWNNQRALQTAYGSLFMLWKQAADRVGPNLTRAAWGKAMTETGPFDQMTSEFPLFFDGRKFDGATTVKGLIFKVAAGDGYKARTFRELTRPQEAYAQRFIP